MLLTVKSIRIKRMNVEIFCERRSQGERGVCKGKRRSQGRVALFLGRSLGRGAFAGSKGCVYDFFAADVRFFCKFEFYVHIHYYF